MKKKVVFIVAVACLLIGFIASMIYNGINNSEVTPPAPENDSVQVKSFTEPIIGVNYYDFEKTLTLDAEYVTMHYGENVFYEATVMLSEKLTDEGLDNNPKPIYIKTVFQAGPKCIMVEHEVTPAGMSSKTTYSEYDDFYMECMPIELPVKMTLDDMLNRLKQTDIVKPASNIVVLRKPLAPPFDGPYYFLGTRRTGFISVNTETGDVHSITLNKVGKPLGEWP